MKLERTGDVGPSQLVLPAGTTTLVKLRVGGTTGPVELHYTATNFLIAPETGLPVVLEISE
jgi:hypothetical protein